MAALMRKLDPISSTHNVFVIKKNNEYHLSKYYGDGDNGDNAIMKEMFFLNHTYCVLKRYRYHCYGNNNTTIQYFNITLK